MAFKKSKTVKGFACEYWRLLEIHSNFNRGDFICTLGLYKDKVTRDANGDDTVLTVQFDMGSDILDATGNNDTVKNINIAKAYTAIKARAIVEANKQEGKDQLLAFFSDAVDA